MLTLSQASARIHLPSLLIGVLHYEYLRLEGMRLMLERRTDGQANWKFGKPSSAKANGGLALVPKNRTQFPTLIDFALQDGVLVYRAAGRPDITIAVHEGAIASPGDDTPVSLVLDGTYNGRAARISGDTQSFKKMRRTATPFGVALQMAAANATLNFDGTLMEPMDFDGAQGRLAIDAKSVGDLLNAFGSDEKLAVPLLLTGQFSRTGDDWKLDGTEERFATSPFRGDLALHEGPRGQPDKVHVDLSFATLELKPLLTGAGAGGGKPIDFTGDPGTLFDGRVRGKGTVGENIRDQPSNHGTHGARPDDGRSAAFRPRQRESRHVWAGPRRRQGRTCRRGRHDNRHRPRAGRRVCSDDSEGRRAAGPRCT